MIVCKFFEHADHVVLIGIHEALGGTPWLRAQKAGTMGALLCWYGGDDVSLVLSFGEQHVYLFSWV